ncbi:MAG: ribonuclease D [Anaerolineae bacterium]|nr:ribonuclease D [Anaerolineae bacterium]
MTPPALPAATFIDTPQSLRRLLDDLRDAPLLAVDTESNSLYAYRERVCLIQVSTRRADYLIDPLALDDMSALSPLMADPAVEKVFHAAEYDIMCLKRDFGWQFANLFDTMIAARILGWRQVGLGNVLGKEFGVKVDKRHQRANWGERPLPPDRLRYAQMDTHYLPTLRDRQAQALRAGRHWEEAQETFADLVSVPAAEHNFDPEGFWSVNGTRDLSREKMALVRELYLLRDRMARERDCPPFKIFSDATLVALAVQAPKGRAALRAIRGMSAGQVQRYGEAILQALRRGERSDPPRLPRRNDVPPPDVLARYDALHVWRRDRASARGVESDVIVSRDVLWSLARSAPPHLGRTQQDRRTGRVAAQDLRRGTP